MKLILTDDGSHSLYRDDLKEGYHSHHGAVQESRHVFIQHGLQAWLAEHPDREPTILELGLGTGLNALLTWEAALPYGKTIRYSGVEAHPVPEEIWQQLNYPEFATALPQADHALAEIHRTPWDEGYFSLGPLFQLEKRKGKIEEIGLTEAFFDLIYFDAFAPNKQGELWEPAVLERMASVMRTGGYLTTYCAKGQFKRDLKAAGFTVETLPGAPGKAEMVRGVRN
ncbi:MAG: tRNA (5-methylaminomethyl-2-thiouridine)(34)-methyltransferase MnmD [Bacteroidota bacterium]